MKKLFASALAALVLVPTLAMPVSAVRYAVPEDGLKASVIDGWYVVTADRYDGPDYNAALEDMAAMTAAAEADGSEVGVPDTLTIDAVSVEDAESQIRSALDYTPDHIAVTMPSSAEARELYQTYKGWTPKVNDLFLTCIETAYKAPVSVAMDGSTVTFTVRYKDAWLAYVETQDGLRVFEDEDYCNALEQFATVYLDPLAEDDITDADRLWAIRTMLLTETEYDQDAYDRSCGSSGIYTNISCHNLYGLFDDQLLVCDGYASVIDFACAYLDIDSFNARYKTGYLMSHISNKVCVDGVWYNLDIVQEQKAMQDFGDEALYDAGFFLTKDSSIRTEDYKVLYSWMDETYPCTEFYGYTPADAA